MEVVFDEVVHFGTQSYKYEVAGHGVNYVRWQKILTILTVMNVCFAFPTSVNYFAPPFPLPDTPPLSLVKLVEAPANSQGSCSSGIGGVAKE